MVQQSILEQARTEGYASAVESFRQRDMLWQDEVDAAFEQGQFKGEERGGRWRIRLFLIGCLVGAALVVLLAGCGGDQPQPAIEVRTVTVDRMVPVPCVKREQIPVKPAMLGSKLNGDSAHDNAILGAALARMGAAFDEAAALLGACVGG